MSDPLIDVEIGGLPGTQGAGTTGGHWAKRHREKKHWMALVVLATHKGRPEKPLERARLRLTRYSTTEPDADNLAASFKYVLDGLIAGSVIVDDKPSVIGSPEFCWEKAKRNGGKIRIEVWAEESGA